MEKQDFRKLLESMYELYEQGMYRIAYGILNNREQAEDAVQDSFEKLLKYTFPGLTGRIAPIHGSLF